MEKIRKYCNYIGVFGCLLLLLGNFLTFVTVKASVLGISHGEPVKFIDGDGVFVIVAAIIAFALIYLKKGKWNYIPAIVSLAVAFYDVADAKDAVSEIGSLAKVDISYGIGFFIIIIGAIAVAAYAYLYKDDDSNILPLTKDVFAKKVNDAVNQVKKATDSLTSEEDITEEEDTDEESKDTKKVTKKSSTSKQTKANTKVCSKCGAKNSKATKFCKSCGEKL